MAIKFDFTANNSNFVRSAQEAERSVQNITRSVEDAANSVKGLATQIAGLAGLSFGLGGIASFVSKVFEVRSYFQDINSSMVAFLGNQAKADEFTQKLKDYAWYNMFEFGELAQASQQMIAYGVAVDNIIPTIDRLSNIAVATKANLLDLVGMYNKAKSIGQIGSEGVQMWGNRGLDIKRMLKEMGEAASGTTITFEQLNKVIEHATDEGGLFYGQQEKMMDNLSSSWGQLQDDMDGVMDTIGEAMQGPMKNIIEQTSKIVHDNEDAIKDAAVTAAEAASKAYELIGDHLGELIAMYGIYRAAQAGAMALDKTAGSIVYEEQVNKLRELLTVKQGKTATDVEEAVSTGRLTEESAKRVVALREEIDAEEDAYKAELKHKVARGAMTEEQATELAALRDEIDEKYKLAALNDELAKQEEQEANLANNLAEGKISDLYKELAAAEANNDVVAQSNILEEIDIATDNKKAASERLKTAQENANTASVELNTAATARNQVAQVASIRTMGLAKAAGVQLRNIWLSISAAMDANPIGLIVAAVVALGYAVYKLATYETEEEAAARKVKEAHDEFTASAASEQREIDRLFGALKGAKEGTEQYNNAKNKILTNYSQYLEGLSEEVKSLKDVEAAYKAISVAARQAVKDRIINSQLSDISDDYEKIVTEQTAKLREILENGFGAEEGNRYLSQIQMQIQETGKISDTLKDKIRNAVKGTFDFGKLPSIFQALEKAEADVVARTQQVYDTFGENTKDFSKLTENGLNGTLIALNKAKKALESGKEKITVTFLDGAKETFMDTATIDLYIKKVEEAQAALHPKAEEKPTDGDKEYWEKQKKLAEGALNSIESKQLEALNAGKFSTEGATEEETQRLTAIKNLYDENKKLLADAQRHLKTYSEALADNQKKVKQSVQDAMKLRDLLDAQSKSKKQENLNIANDTEQAMIDVDDEGHDKRLRQLDLNHKKELEALQKFEEDYKEKAEESARKIWEAQNAELVRNNPDAWFTSGAQSQWEEMFVIPDNVLAYIKAKTDAINKQFEDAVADENASLNVAWNEYLLEYGTYSQQLEAAAILHQKNLDKILSEGGDTGLLAQENQRFDEQVADIHDKFGIVGKDTEETFKRIGKASTKEINKAIKAYKDLIKAMKNGVLSEADKRKALDAGFSEDFLKLVESCKVTIDDLTDQLDQLNEAGVPIVKTFKKVGDAFSKVFSPKGEGESDDDFAKRKKEGLQEIGEGLLEVGEYAGQVTDAVANMFAAFGNDSTAQALQRVGSVLDSMGSYAAMGAQIGGGWGALAGAVVGLGTSLASVLTESADDAANKRLEQLNKQLKAITRSYEKLDEVVNKTFSTDKARNIDAEILNLQRQNVVLNQMIREEQSKKNSDSNAIEGYRDQIYQNQQQILKLKEATKDAIFGEDITSAIQNFATAYADAWAQNTNRTKTAKEQVRQMMVSMIQESIKAATQSSKAMDKIREKMLDFYRDGFFTEEEQEALYREAQALQEDLDARFGWADKLLDDDSNFTQKGTSGGFATMSQESADELNGRFTAMNMHMDKAVQTLIAMSETQRMMHGIQTQIAATLSEIRNLSIASNSYAEDTAAYTKQLTAFGQKLDAVNRNLELRL